MKAELASLQREKQQLAERLGDLHPDMIKVNTGIANAQSRLDAEISKVVDGIQNDYRNAQAKERGLQSALGAQEREVLESQSQSIGYNSLQRDASATQQMFNTVLQRAKETELTGELQSNNIKILDTAEIPRTPVLPRTSLNLAVALFGGCFFGAGPGVGNGGAESRDRGARGHCEGARCAAARSRTADPQTRRQNRKSERPAVPVPGSYPEHSNAAIAVERRRGTADVRHNQRERPVKARRCSPAILLWPWQ